MNSHSTDLKEICLRKMLKTILKIDIDYGSLIKCEASIFLNFMNYKMHHYFTNVSQMIIPCQFFLHC